MTIEDLIRQIVREELNRPLTPEAMRLVANLSREELAERAGVARATIQRIEAGSTKHLNEKVLNRIASVFPDREAYILAAHRRTA